MTARVRGSPRPLGTIKDAACVWRQMVFHLSRCSARERERTLPWLTEESRRHPAHVAARLAPALTGLRQVDEGGEADAGEGRRLLGRTTGAHWLRPDPAEAD